MSAQNAVKIDGSKKTWPARLDGVVVTFPTIPEGASLEDAVAFLKANSESPEAAVYLIRSAVEQDQTTFVRGTLNAKAREDGKTYTRDELKKLPQVSAKISKEDTEKLGSDWQVTLPRRGSGAVSKLKVAEQTARREAEKANAATKELLATLALLPKKQAEEKLAALVSAGILPEGTTL